MEYRELGLSGLRVSVLTMGMLMFAGAGTTDAEEADRRQSPADLTFLVLQRGV
jgi:aryl-alcohol dehydrogenase-like predicted oxidoreductase